MKQLLASLSLEKHALGWILFVEGIPAGVFEFLKDAGWHPVPEHAVAFVATFSALLIAAGFSSMRLRNHTNWTIES